MIKESYYGRFYHDPTSPDNLVRPFASSQSKGLERIDSILTRVAEIPESGLTGQSAVQSNIGLEEVEK